MYFEWKSLYFDLNFITVYSRESKHQSFNICSGNLSTADRWQSLPEPIEPSSIMHVGITKPWYVKVLPLNKPCIINTKSVNTDFITSVYACKLKICQSFGANWNICYVIFPGNARYVLWLFLTIPHEDDMTWKWFQHYWPFVTGIYWWPVDSPYKGPIMWSFIFSPILG